MNICCQEVTIWWPYPFKSWLIANQYFSRIQYIKRVSSHGIQTVICSAFHGIFSFCLLCILMNSKKVLYLSRFPVLRPLCNKPFGSVRALRAFTGLTVLGHPPSELSLLAHGPRLHYSPVWLSVHQHSDGNRSWWSGITFHSPVYVKLFLWEEWLRKQGVFILEERREMAWASVKPVFMSVMEKVGRHRLFTLSPNEGAKEHQIVEVRFKTESGSHRR